MNVDGQCLDRGLTQTATPGGHDCPSPVLDALDDALLVGTVEPDLVREARRADLTIALALLPVADGAVVREHFLAKREIGARLGRQPGQRTGVVCHGRNLIWLQNIVATERRHGARPPFIVNGARTKANGLLDIGELATPKPTAVVEVGLALVTTPTRSMTRRAVVGEGHASLRPGEVEQPRIRDNAR